MYSRHQALKFEVGVLEGHEKVALGVMAGKADPKPISASVIFVPMFTTN